MKTTLDFCDDVVIVRLYGELDHHLATQVREQVDATVQTGAIRHIAFDFSNVSFMDSSGIGVLMGRYKLMQLVGGKVSIFGTSPMMDKLIAMSGIKKIIGVYGSEDAALGKGANA